LEEDDAAFGGISDKGDRKGDEKTWRKVA